jgi:hypothetical protein
MIECIAILVSKEADIQQGKRPTSDVEKTYNCTYETSAVILCPIQSSVYTYPPLLDQIVIQFITQTYVLPVFTHPMSDRLGDAHIVAFYLSSIYFVFCSASRRFDVNSLSVLSSFSLCLIDFIKE